MSKHLVCLFLKKSTFLELYSLYSLNKLVRKVYKKYFKCSKLYLKCCFKVNKYIICKRDMSLHAAITPKRAPASPLVLYGMVALHPPSIKNLSVWNWRDLARRHGWQKRVSHKWNSYGQPVKQLEIERIFWVIIFHS